MQLSEIKEYFKSLSDKKFTKDVFINIVSSVILAVSGLLINILIGNHYHSEGLGIFNQALSIYLIFTIVSVWGVNNSIIKYTAQHKDNKTELDNIINTGFYLVLFISILITVIINISASFFPSIYPNSNVCKALINISVSIPLFSLNRMLLAILNGIRKMFAYAFAQTIRWFLVIGFIIFSQLTGKSLYFTILAFPFAEVILFIWLIIYTSKYFTFRLHFIKLWGKEHLSFGFKTLLISSIGEINTNIDILMIGYLMGNYYVGIFSFASTIAKGILLIPAVIQLNFNPIISSLWAKKQIEQLKNHIKSILKINFVLMFCVILLIGIAYPIFIKIFMKDTIYMSSLPVFYILIIGIFIVSVFYFLGALQSMAGYPEIQLMITGITCAFNIIVNFIFIKLFGIIGAAVSTSLSLILVVILLSFYSKRKLGIDILKMI